LPDLFTTLFAEKQAFVRDGMSRARRLWKEIMRATSYVRTHTDITSRRLQALLSNLYFKDPWGNVHDGEFRSQFRLKSCFAFGSVLAVLAVAIPS
jgi:hypothetical protein